MQYAAKPHEGIGPVRLGMTRAQVKTALGTPAQPFRKTEQASHDTDAFDEVGFHVYYKDEPEQVEFVEVFPVESVQFTLFGMNVFATPAKEIIERLQRTFEAVVEEDGCSLLLRRLDTALWRSDPEELYFEALGVGSRGYYEEEAV